MSNAQSKQIFSVSQKYNEVFDILNRVDNKSEFICQAIIEKFNGIETSDDSLLEKKIRKVLKDMITEENLFIVSVNSTVPTPVEVPPKTVVENKDIENTSSESDQEEEDYLKNVLLNM